MKTIDDALELRGRILGAFEVAEATTDPEERARRLTFVVVGGGPTGVELAGQIAELARLTLPGAFRTIDPAECRVMLFDGSPFGLSPMAENLGPRAQRQLEKMGVEVHPTRWSPTSTTWASGSRTRKRRRAPDRRACKVWAAGVQASPPGHLIAKPCEGTEVDRCGRVVVEPDLTVKGHPDVFVVGDMVTLPDVPVWRRAPSRRRSTRPRRSSGLSRDDDPAARVPFKYWDKGTMATIGRLSAIVDSGPLHLSGVLGWLAWLFIHLVTLTGFRNRLAVSYNWAVLFVSHARRQRVITKQQVFAREALQEKLNATPERRISDVADARM